MLTQGGSRESLRLQDTPYAINRQCDACAKSRGAG